MPNSVEELRTAVATMRELGVTEWNGIKLGPIPSAPSDGDEEEPSDLKATDSTKHRAERQRLAHLASGGPVLAGGRPQQPTR